MRHLTVSLFIILTWNFFSPNLALAQLAFGGEVETVVYCTDDVAWIILGPPTAGSYMWLYGELPYREYVPPHPGQWLLGKTLGFMACVEGIYTIGGGLLIYFHGSST